MTNKFNESLLGFVKKQYPDVVSSNYEELYNIYANKKVEFRSPIHTLEIHLENILEKVFQNALKIKQLKHKILRNIEEDDDKIYKMISKIILEDAELLKLELEEVRKEARIAVVEFNQEEIQNIHAKSGKFGADCLPNMGINDE